MLAVLSSYLLASCGDVTGDAAPAEEAASAKSYGFALLGANGSPAPGGGTYANDFEPGGLNSRGQYSYAADVSTGGEGVFLGRGTTVYANHPQRRPGAGGRHVRPLRHLRSRGAERPGQPGLRVQRGPVHPAARPELRRLPLHATSNATTAILVPFVTPARFGGVFQGTGHPRQHQQRPRRRLRRNHQHDGGDLRSPRTWASAWACSCPITRARSPAWSFRAIRRPAAATSTSRRTPGSTTRAPSPSVLTSRATSASGFGTSQDQRVFCAESVYLKPARGPRSCPSPTRAIRQPGGGVLQPGVRAGPEQPRRRRVHRGPRHEPRRRHGGGRVPVLEGERHLRRAPGRRDARRRAAT